MRTLYKRDEALPADENRGGAAGESLQSGVRKRRQEFNFINFSLLKEKRAFFNAFSLAVILWMSINSGFSQNCTANAGGNRTVCGSTITLTGTVSGTLGTLNSPLWTFVSGPVTPTIVTPNNLTTNITGMTVDGNYTFRLTRTCNSGTAVNDVVITAHPRPAGFTAGPDITNICALTGTTPLAGVIPAGYTGSWQAVNIYSLDRLGTTVSTNAQFSSTTTATPTFSLINKANHQIDPAYYTILTITSADGICSYSDTAIVRFPPNPHISFPNKTTCFDPASSNAAQSFIQLDAAPYFSTQIAGAAGTAANGTTVTMNVVSQPSGGALAFSYLDNNFLYFNGINVPGAYTFTLTITDSCGTYTTPQRTFTYNGTRPRMVNFQPSGHTAPEQMTVYYTVGSGGEVHCNLAGTTTPENFYFSIDPLDPASVLTTVTTDGIAPPGGFPTISVSGAGTYNRTVTVTPPGSGWQVGTYKFRVNVSNSDGSCGYGQTYFIHVSDKARPNVNIPDVSVCYPGTGTISATIPLPAVYQGVVNSSYFQDFSGQYDFTVLSRPAGSGVPAYTSGNLRSLTSTTTTISNLTMAGDYVFRVTAAPYNGAVGDFLGREYACSGTSMVDTFVVHVENPINANAGSDQTLNCANSLTLLGNSAGTGTGLWTKISSPSGSNPVIGSTSAANTTVTGVDISGTYSYKWTITSQHGGCSSSDTVSFVVSNVSPATPTTTVSDLMCGGNGYGNITVTSPLGAAYQYSINGTTWQTSPVFNNLLAGTYTVSARFASATTCVSSKTDVVRLRYCGTVFNDTNGDKLITAGENGTNVGGTLYIYAVNFNTGIIENSIPVSSDGTYSIPVSTDVNYNIVLSTVVYPIGTNTTTTPINTTPPAGWVRTGEYINTGDPTADGIIYVIKRNDAKSNLNFGIQQPPLAVNDTTLNNAYGSTVTVNVVNNDRDSTPGTLDMTRVSMVAPGTATNIVTDAQGDITSMTIPGQGTWTVNATTGAITFTPQLGYVGNPTPIQYTIRDNAGAISNSASVVITYLSPAIVSGTVFNDINRNTIINTGENFSSLPVPLYTYLVNSSGIIIDSARVAPNGTYSLDAIRNQAYTVHLSTQQYPLGTNINTTSINHTPPAGFITTGENGGNTGFGDGLPDGILSVTVINSNVLNRNFGITCKTAGTSGGYNICINERSTMSLIEFISGADVGGTWTQLTGSGITLNATGDSITLTSAATTSTYRYDMPATSNCAASSSIATVTIRPVPVTTRNITICEGDSVCVTNPDQGARVLGPRGRVCHTTSGIYTDTLSAASQYACDSIVITNLTVVPKANAGADGSTSICDNSTATITLANLITGEQTGGAWTRLTGTGGTFTAASGTFVPAAGATTSTFRYIVTSASSCGTDTSIATVVITPQANAGADGSTSVCDNSTATITLANLITGEQTGGTWVRLTGTGGTFTAASGTFVPAAGATTSTFRYIVNGTAPCGNDTSIATVTINICAVTISGTVFDDGNGNTIINAGETFTSLPVPLYVYLVNSSGIVVDSAHVSPNGTYTLTANPNQNYTIELSAVQYPVGTNISTTPINNTLPANWVTTGENGNNNTGSGDGHPNGVLSVNVGTVAIAHQNFGIEQRPDSDTITYHLPYSPGAGSDVCLDGFSAPEMSGSDPEDGIYTGSSGTGNPPQGVIITSLPTYGELWYYGMGVPVVISESDITDSTLLDPSLICIVLTGCGYTSTTFEYAYVDAAGVADSTPATYTVTWDGIDTVTLLATNPSCLSTGAVTISSPIGPDYTYSIDSISFRESPYFPGLTAGNYTFYVKKAGNTCISTQSIALTPAVCEPSYCNADLSWNNAEGEIGTYNVTTGDYTVLCTNDNIILGDIAIDQYGQMWGVGFGTDTLYRIDLSSCTFVPVTQVPVRAPNSLSVLPDGTFLMGSGNPYDANGNIVHRYNPATDAFTVWNVFDESAFPDITFPSGDYIYLDGSIYVLWFDETIDATAPHIYKATVDANYNYISHEDLGAVQPFSYGLAKINGELYAVTSIGSATFEQTGTIIKIPLPNVEDWTVAYTGITSLFYGATSYQEVQALDLPVLSDYDISNECPEVTVDLNALLTGAPPAGYSLVWFTNDTHSGTPLSTEQASNVGVGAYYYAYFYNEDVDCYSPVSAPVLVTIDSCPVITGTVFHDPNGNTIINNGEIFTTLPAPLYVYLVNSSGIVVDSAHVQPDGTYTLNAGPNQDYTIELSQVQYPIGTNTAATPINHTPPAGWVNTGENGNNNTGPGDGNPNGVLAVSVGTSSVNNQNFGIQQPPVADNKTYHVSPSAFSETPPFGYPDISTPGARYFTITTDNSMLAGYTHNGSLTGRDEEDCQISESCNMGSTFVLDSLYSTTILFYNFGGEIGVRQLTEGDTIRNYDPSKLVIYVLEGSGIETPVGFTYSIVDHAGFASPPANYTIFTESALPVELLYFTATVVDCKAELNWATASELNNDYFEVQRSTDAKAWSTIVKMEGNGTTSARNDYSFNDSDLPNGTIYYRLKQVDFDGTTEYYKVVQVESGSCNNYQVKVYPNPVSDVVTIEAQGKIFNSSDRQLILTDALGRNVMTITRFENISKLNVSHLPAGMYFIRIIAENRVVQAIEIIVTR